MRGSFALMTPHSTIPQTSVRRVLLILLLSCVPLASCKKPGVTENAQNVNSGPQLKWQYKSSSFRLTHPAVASDGTIYVGTTRDGLQALSPDGKLLWRTNIAHAGVPVLGDDGNLYFAMPEGLMFGANREGKIVWDPGYGLIGFSVPPALGPDGLLYYINSASDVWAFQPSRQKRELWSLDTFREGFIKPNVLPGYVEKGMPHDGGALAVGRDGNLYVSRQNFLHAISPSGSVVWTVELTTGSLAVADDGSIYISCGGVLIAVDASGTEKWRLDSGAFGSPVIDNQGTIYFTDGIAVSALNPDGSLKWRYAQPGPPAMRFSTAPAIAADGTLYLGGGAGLIALTSDGKLKWNLRVPSPTSSPTIAPDGTILFACNPGLCAVQDSGSPLMQSAWPKQFHDLGNTSNSLTAMN